MSEKTGWSATAGRCGKTCKGWHQVKCSRTRRHKEVWLYLLLPRCSKSFFVLIPMQEMDPASSSKLSESDIVTNIQQESDRLQTKIGDERKYHVVKYFTVFLKASENDSFSFDGSTSGLPVLIDYKHCLCSVLHHLHES